MAKWIKKRNKWIRLSVLGIVLAVQIPMMARFVPGYGLWRVVRECRSGIADAVREALA